MEARPNCPFEWLVTVGQDNAHCFDRRSGMAWPAEYTQVLDVAGSGSENQGSVREELVLLADPRMLVME